jgi:hypothetical protein
MGRREDLLRQEAEGWQRIDGLVGDLTPEQIERPGYTDEGWSVKDMMWHVAAWSEELGEVRPDADEWFEESGPAHYDEHLPDLHPWVERLR